MKSESNSLDAIPKVVIRATAVVLEPLVHFLVNYGIGFQAFQELVKSTYVKVADDKFKLEERAQTDSRISLLTGVHRRDVRRLRNIGDDFEDGVSQRVGIGSQIVSLWMTDKRYLDERDKPKPLPRQAGDSSFENLVATFSLDMRPRVLLDEWLRLGVVHLDEDDNVHLNTGAFVPNNGMREKAYYMATNVRDHLAAAANNVMGTGEAPYLERSVQYNELSKASVDELSVMAEELTMEALHALNRRASELSKRDSGQQDACYRINFGAYCYKSEDYITTTRTLKGD